MGIVRGVRDEKGIVGSFVAIIEFLNDSIQGLLCKMLEREVFGEILSNKLVGVYLSSSLVCGLRVSKEEGECRVVE